MASSIPPALKTAIVTPILKKPSDELDELSNYRPVSNLPYLSKLLEKVVSSRLHNHKVTNNLYEHVQSAYRSGHSTETALVKVQNDILHAIDHRLVPIVRTSASTHRKDGGESLAEQL